MASNEEVLQALKRLGRVYVDYNWTREKLYRYDERRDQHCYCLGGGIALSCGGPITPPSDPRYVYHPLDVFDFLTGSDLTKEVIRVLASSAGYLEPNSRLRLQRLVRWNDLQDSVEPIQRLIQDSIARLETA